MRTATALLLTLASALPAQKGLITHKTREALIKTNVSKPEAIEFGKKLDRYVELFDGFYKPFGLRRKNDNRIIVRLMATREEFERFWSRRHSGSAPAAFFSPSLNALVLYHDPTDPWLRQTLFHEASHQYLNRYSYETPVWFNEGLAEYFEGWWIPEAGDAETRPALFDLILVQNAMRDDAYLTPSQLAAMDRKTFQGFPENSGELHHYLHYATAWSFTYYCLEGGNEGDRAAWSQFLKDINDRGARAEFAPPGGWDAFEERWRKYVRSLKAERKDIDDYLLVASAYRDNGDIVKAVREYKALLKAHPEASDRVQYWLGYCYKRGGLYEPARRYLEKANEVDPEDARPAYLLARMSLGIDRRKGAEPSPEQAAEALAFAEEAVRRSPRPAYRAFVARCQAAAGNTKAAVKTLRAVIRKAPSEDRDHYENLLAEIRGKKRK